MSPRMHLLAPIIALAALASFEAGCKPGDTTWPRVANCARDLPKDVVEKVFTVLEQDGQGELSDGAVKQLEDFAVERGGELVACAIGQIINSLVSAPPPGTDNASSRGRAFLARKQVKVEGSPRVEP